MPLKISQTDTNETLNQSCSILQADFDPFDITTKEIPNLLILLSHVLLFLYFLLFYTVLTPNGSSI
jgi:hypothetical protein